MKRFMTWMLIAALLVSMLAMTACNTQEAQQPTDPVETTGTQPTGAPTDPTDAPTDPTDAPADPTDAPTDPVDAPTEEPTAAPTEGNTVAPTQAPTNTPTQAPTVAPTAAPTQAPTQKPTQAPTQKPTQAATQKPTQAPTQPATTRPGWGSITVPTQAPTQAVDAITITGPTGEVYGYVENARNYLLDTSNSRRVDKYRDGTQKNAAKPIDITWDTNFTADSFTVRYSTNSNMSNAKEVSVSGSARKASVYNLLKGTTYYVEISAKNGSGKTVVATSTFKTSDIGPRVMNVDTAYNIRDIGGYKTADGKVTKQGMIYRGDALYPCEQSTSNLSEAGKKFMSEEMGIKLEIDFRSPSESKYPGTTSIIPGARLEYITISAYSDIFNNGEQVAKIFKAMADIDNYPIYIHCTGGADRTATVAYLLNALLGVDEKTLIEDYEFTTFSIYGTRSTYSGTYSGKFMGLQDTVAKYNGSTQAEKVEDYLLRIGLTQAEIDSIKSIMKG